MKISKTSELILAFAAEICLWGLMKNNFDLYGIRLVEMTLLWISVRAMILCEISKNSFLLTVAIYFAVHLWLPLKKAPPEWNELWLDYLDSKYLLLGIYFFIANDQKSREIVSGFFNKIFLVFERPSRQTGQAWVIAVAFVVCATVRLITR